MPWCYKNYATTSGYALEVDMTDLLAFLKLQLRAQLACALR